MPESDSLPLGGGALARSPELGLTRGRALAVRRKRGRLALSVVIPAFDEEKLIASSLQRLIPHLEELGHSFEVLVVDDGSTDRTGDILLEAARADRRVRILWLAANLGKGAALRAGMRAAHGRRVVTMDADLATDLEVLPRLLQRLEGGADVVFGDRRDPRSRTLVRQPPLREWLGYGFTRLARMCIDPGVRDFTCGLKGYSRRAARSIAARTWIDGWACDAEIAALVRGLRLRRATVPVSWRHVDGSKVRVRRACLGALRDLGRIVWGRLAGRYRGSGTAPGAGFAGAPSQRGEKRNTPLA